MKITRLFISICAISAPISVAFAAEPAPNQALTQVDVFAPAFTALRKSDGMYATNLSPQELDKLERENVEANREALAQLRILLQNSPQGFASRRYDTAEESEKAFKISSNLREFARLLVRESNVRLADGDAVGAMQSRLDCYQLAVSFSRGGMIIDGLTSAALVALAWNNIEKVGLQLDGNSCVEFAKRIETIKRNNVTYAELLENERDHVLAESRKQFKDVDMTAIPRILEEGKLSPEEKEQLRSFDPEKIQTNLAAAFELSIAAAKKPFSHLAMPVKVEDGYSQSLLSTVDNIGTRFSFERSETRTRLVQAALLLRAKQSGELAEADFKRLLPRDPFSDGSLKVNDLVVYSVGPDGEDDGGEPFKQVWRGFDPKTGQYRTVNAKVLQHDSVGDVIGPDFIVAPKQKL